MLIRALGNSTGSNKLKSILLKMWNKVKPVTFQLPLLHIISHPTHKSDIWSGKQRGNFIVQRN